MIRRALAFRTASALLVGAVGCRAPQHGAVIGEPAPEFRASVIGATTATFKGPADYRGKVTLVNLWATWCIPCITEMPTIQKLYDRYRDSGFVVAAVATDDPPFADRVRDFAAERHLTFEILHDGSGDIEQAYGTRGIPSTYLLDREGRVRLIRQGSADWDTPAMRTLVSNLLR